METEIKNKTQLNYLKKKIENKTKINIQKIESVRYPENFEEVIRGIFTINNRLKYFIFPSWKDKGLLNKEINKIINEINNMKEKQNSIK